MCMVDDGDEMPKVWRSEVRKAAKVHGCDECGREIARGETYRWYTGLYDGHWGTQRICSHCGVATDWLMAECGGFLHFAVADDIKEHVDEYQRYDLARLYVGMKRKWARFFGPGLMPLPPMPAVTP